MSLTHFPFSDKSRFFNQSERVLYGNFIIIFHIFCIFSFASHTSQNSQVEVFYANSYGKIKSRKNSLGKGNKGKWPKEERNSSNLSRKERKPLLKLTKALG